MEEVELTAREEIALDIYLMLLNKYIDEGNPGHYKSPKKIASEAFNYADAFMEHVGGNLDGD